VVDSIILALSRHSSLDQDLRVEIWLRALHTLQSTLTMSPSLHSYLGLTQ